MNNAAEIRISYWNVDSRVACRRIYVQSPPGLRTWDMTSCFYGEEYSHLDAYSYADLKEAEVYSISDCK